MLAGCQEVCDRFGLPRIRRRDVGQGLRDVRFEPVIDYRSYVEYFDDDLNYLAWLYHMNHGVFMTPGGDEQWTLSIAHTDAELDHYIAVFEQFAADVTGSGLHG